MPILKDELRTELQKIAEASEGGQISQLAEMRKLRAELLEKIPSVKASLIERLQAALAEIDNLQGQSVGDVRTLRQALTKAKQIADAPGPNPGMTGPMVDH